MIKWIMGKLKIRFETPEETARRIKDENKHEPWYIG